MAGTLRDGWHPKGWLAQPALTASTYSQHLQPALTTLSKVHAVPLDT